MFQVADAFYVGGQLSYKDLKYEANNTAGKEFIVKNAMVDEQAGGIGLAFSFDNRKNKFYPRNATWISLNINSNPSWLGSEVDYYHTIINARHYAKGFKKDDV